MVVSALADDAYMTLKPRQSITVRATCSKTSIIVFTREEWAAMCERHGSKMRYPYADVIPFRRHAPPHKPSQE